MDYKLIKHIRKKVTTNRWINGKVGSFEYDLSSYSYRFIGTTKDLECYLYAERVLIIKVAEK